jgi:transposase
MTDMGLRKSYSRSRNSVEEFPFEMTMALPRKRPLSHRDPDDLALLRRIVRDHPQATLHQLCERIKAKHHLTTSPSNLSRALKYLDLSHRKMRGFKSRDMAMPLATPDRYASDSRSGLPSMRI